MSGPGLRRVLVLGGTEALGDLLLALPKRLQEGVAQKVVQYLEAEWDSLTADELKELELPKAEVIEKYLTSLQEDITQGEAEVAELEGRITQATEEEKGVLKEELEYMKDELEVTRANLKEVQERQQQYSA
jgi:hypothetical protein